MPPSETAYHFAQFDRNCVRTQPDFTMIGSGELGGKARGLAFMKAILQESPESRRVCQTAGVIIRIPTLTVITTELFDEFLKLNHLQELAYASASDDYLLAHAFQHADLPVMMLGDLRSLLQQIHTPLAIRSSSLLEDSIDEPLAGIYTTKMIPNNQASLDVRFQKLVEAIKLVYASTFFIQAKNYLKATRHTLADEKMAVIIQEVVGLRQGACFYPNISGVARSYNFYPTGKAAAEDGVINLALGLGKTIVDGGVSWFYSPAYPTVFPPSRSPRDLLKQTQLRFWAINMGNLRTYDPFHEAEYLVHPHIVEAEKDGTLDWVASTYNAQSDRIDIGLSGKGPRILTFAPILQLQRLPLNEILKVLLSACKKAIGSEVEIEFALAFDPKRRISAKFGFLQVRPMAVSNAVIEISDAEFSSDRVLARSDEVLGNGQNDRIVDIVYVEPAGFDAKETPQIAQEIAAFNAALVEQGRKYLLIGFGRWGSADPWLGIPVHWSQIHGAQVIIEATLPQMNPELSQGSHFFHNLIGFQVLYFSITHSQSDGIDWQWLRCQPAVQERRFVRHIHLDAPLRIKVDGRTRKGVILR
jgi:hypothetical protein